MRRTTSVRVIALAAIALFSIGQFGAVAHEETEHTICPEHGEAIHAEPSTSHERAPGWSARTESESHAEHCGAFFSLQARASSARPLSFAVPAVLPFLVRPALEATPSIALLALAPKASPPVRA